MLQKIINYYNTNAYFHSFVGALEGALLVFFATYNGGIPSTRAAWLILIGAVVKALFNAAKRWTQTNVATAAIPMKKVIEPIVVVERDITKGETII